MIPKDFLLKKHTDLTIHQLHTNRSIKKIILHCSATAEGKDVTVATIRKWHLARKFNDIGYHYVIYRDGSINIGRDINKIGAHTEGHNTGSIGICYIGGCAKDGRTPKDTRTPEQKIALYKLIDDLLMLYPTAEIHCHYEYANKACPSFKLETFKQEYKLWLETQKITPKCNLK